MKNNEEISPCPICKAPRKIESTFGGVTIPFSCDHGEEVMDPFLYNLKKEILKDTKQKDTKQKEWKISKEGWKVLTGDNDAK